MSKRLAVLVVALVFSCGVQNARDIGEAQVHCQAMCSGTSVKSFSVRHNGCQAWPECICNSVPSPNSTDGGVK